MESGIFYSIDGEMEDIEMGKSKTESLVDVVEKINQIDIVTAVVDPVGLIEVRVGTIEVASVDIDMKYGIIITEDFNEELPEETRGELLSLLADISSRMPLVYEEQYEVYIKSLDDEAVMYLYISEYTGKAFFTSNSSTKFTEDELRKLPYYILEGIQTGLFKKRQVI